VSRRFFAMSFSGIMGASLYGDEQYKGIGRAIMGLSSMDKMWASFFAMGLMVAASLLISFARVKTKGFVRWTLSAIAFIVLIISIIYMLLSLL
jgi:hypothetical protein